MNSSTDFSTVARKTGLSESAVRTLFEALVSGGGSQAQFDHPDLGGHGQWMRGGMTMVGDMFNNDLKAKVAAACEQLANAATKAAPERVAAHAWWPKELGRPRSAAVQDELSYALFEDRVAVRMGKSVKIYELGGNEASGVGMQNGRIVIHTSRGTVPIDSLETADTED